MDDYAPGYGVIFNVLVAVEGKEPGDVDWDLFLTRNGPVYESYKKLCKEHNLTNIIEKAKYIVSKDLIKAAFIPENKMCGEYDKNMDYFTELSNTSWAAFDTTFHREDARYQTVIDFHANLTKEDPVVGHLAGKPFKELSESEVLELMLILNPFFFVLTDYIADWDEEKPYGKLKFTNEIFFSGLMDYANGRSSVSIFEDICSAINEQNPEYVELKAALEQKSDYVVELTERLANKGVVPDITAEKAKEWGLIYDVVDGEVIITKCASRDMMLIIPRTIDGVPVKQIKNAIQWSALSSVESAVIFADLEYICDYAFSAFTELRIISLIGSIARTGANFAERTKVEVSVKEGVKYIRVNDNPYYMAVGFNEDVADIVHFDKQTKFVGSFAFMKAPIKSVIMPAVVSIGKLAFSSCNNLEYIDFPDTLNYIGERAFAMTKVCGLEINVEELADGVFYSCGLLRELKLGPKIKKIGFEAFGDTDLFEFEIPESVESFNSGMFGEISRIQEVYIPGDRVWKDETTGVVYEPDDFSDPGVTAEMLLNMDYTVFTVVGHSSIRVDFEDKSEEVNIFGASHKDSFMSASNKTDSSKNEETKDSKVVKHLSNEEAAEQGFDCWVSPRSGRFVINGIDTTAKKLDIPVSIGGQTIEEIGRNALMENDSLEGVTIHGRLIIGNRFLMDCPNVKYVNIEDGVEEIGCDFLTNNPHLITEKDNVFYAKVNSNPYYVAVGCNKEAGDLFVDDACEVIADHAFDESNASLITIPNAKIVGSAAFHGCKNLNFISINKEAKLLENCFNECDALVSRT